MAQVPARQPIPVRCTHLGVWILPVERSWDAVWWRKDGECPADLFAGRRSLWGFTDWCGDLESNSADDDIGLRGSGDGDIDSGHLRQSGDDRCHC